MRVKHIECKVSYLKFLWYLNYDGQFQEAIFRSLNCYFSDFLQFLAKRLGIEYHQDANFCFIESLLEHTSHFVKLVYLWRPDIERTLKKSTPKEITDLKKNQSNADNAYEEKCFVLGLNIPWFRCHCDDFIMKIKKNYKTESHCSYTNLRTKSDTELKKTVQNGKSFSEKRLSHCPLTPIIIKPNGYW